MQTYKILNHDGYNGQVYGAEVSLSSVTVNSWIAGGAKLQNVTPLPTVWERDANSFFMEPSDHGMCKSACADGYAHILSVYDTLILTVSVSDLKKRSYWKAQALAYAEAQSDEETCKQDCYEGWLRGVIGYVKAKEMNMDPIVESELYMLGVS